MASVRLLVGTRKGAFILHADAARKKWKIQGPLFGGWEIYHVAGSPADPDRLYASQVSDWFGQVIQRSDDGGKSWNAVGNEFTYRGETGTHQWYDGSQKPWEFKRVWHLEPAPGDPDTVYAGVEDAALFCTRDGGHSWQEFDGLRRHTSGPDWMPGAGGMCLHTILLHPQRPERITVAISAAGAFRSDDHGSQLAADQSRPALGADPRPARTGGALRTPARRPSLPSRCAVHAEALGCDAQRRRRRQLA